MPEPRNWWELDEQPFIVDVAERTRTNAYLSHSDYTVPDALHEVARQIPDRVAIESGDDRITFGEIVSRANQVANALLDRGLDKDTPALLLCDHGIAPPVAICGVLHAGLIAAPVDVKEPVERLHRLVEASGADWIVSDRPHVDLARALGDKILVLDEAARYDDTAPAVEINGDQPGLILFTSGSTGVPKGVYGAHRAIVPKSMRNNTHRLSGDERYALMASWGFTAAEGQLFHGLVNGLPTCTYDLRTRGPRRLPEWVRDSGITQMTLMPSVLRRLVDDTPPRMMDCVRVVSFGAETLYADDVRAARPLFGPETVFQHAIGATECGRIAGWDLPHDAELDDGPVPLGRPGAQCEVRIVDEDDQPVPDGEAGRIVVLRRGHLARGYWRNPELTAAHFFREPDGRQGFRTSDRGRFRPDGMLEHLGRLDTRVKVRGAMVATSEVEIALMGLDGVADAAVIAVPTDGGTRLVAYVAPDGSAPLSAWKLRRDVAARVPTTMVPSAFVALDTLPRSIRHKLDRAALPPAPPPAQQPYRAPAGDAARLADLYAEVLGFERVGLDDDFFEMGGDSLGVLELLAGIRKHFGVDIAASTVLAAPTVGELATRIHSPRRLASDLVVPLRVDTRGPSIFFIPGGGGAAIGLRALAEAIDGHDVYAIQAHGLEQRALPDRTVEAVARRNIDVMRTVQPRGPYRLGGYSFGGMVAFDMACRLRAAGEAVDLVIMLDTHAPLGEHDLAARAQARARSLRASAPERGVARAAILGARWVSFATRSAYEHVERRVVITSVGLVMRRGDAQYDAFYRLHASMARKYRPSATFDGPVLVVRTEHGTGDLGWSKLTTGTVTVVEVRAPHLDLLRAPAVEQVGQLVSDAAH